MDRSPCLTVFRKRGHKFKVRFTPETVLFVRAALLILAKDAEVAVQGAILQHERTGRGYGKETAEHWRQVTKGIAIIEQRLRLSFPRKLFESAVEALIESETPGRPVSSTGN